MDGQNKRTTYTIPSHHNHNTYDKDRVTTQLENLEKSGNSKVVREKSGKWKKSGKSRGK